MIMLQSAISSDRDSPGWPRVVFDTDGRVGPVVDRFGVVS